MTCNDMQYNDLQCNDMQCNNMQCDDMQCNALLLLLTGVRSERPGESENTRLVRRPQPHATNPWKEEKEKIVEDKKERDMTFTRNDAQFNAITCNAIK